MNLFCMPLPVLLRHWRPGSYDWEWLDEYWNLMHVNPAVTDAVRARVESEGFGFADAFGPILLGSDGRVWDGHHRICIAIEKRQPYLWVELT